MKNDNTYFEYLVLSKNHSFSENSNENKSQLHSNYMYFVFVYFTVKLIWLSKMYCLRLSCLVLVIMKCINFIYKTNDFVLTSILHNLDIVWSWRWHIFDVDFDHLRVIQTTARCWGKCCANIVISTRNIEDFTRLTLIGIFVCEWENHISISSSILLPKNVWYDSLKKLKCDDFCGVYDDDGLHAQHKYCERRMNKSQSKHKILFRRHILPKMRFPLLFL